MTFFQDPPRLANQYDDDALLREYLDRVLPFEVLREIEPELREIGDEAVKYHQMQVEDRLNEPRLTQWDPWGHRIDRIEVSPLWQEAAKLACRRGLVATAYERRHGDLSRIHQFALVYLVDASLDVYSCPLAMTDGAARTLLELEARALAQRAVPRLTSRDPEVAWTSGQWMTERTGGSDVGLSEAVARESSDGWRLYGTKWFTSATTSQMALTLARPDGNPPGGRGLALFYLELKDRVGRWNGIQVNRLKDKLGTRKVPTAELDLDGALAEPVAGLSDGVKNITPMLQITRIWNSVGAISGMRRAIALSRDYARRRAQFGAKLSEKPLHRDTIAGMQAELEGAFHLTFRAVELLGLREAHTATEADQKLLRIITPLVKLTTGKQAVAVTSEAVECFGGAGYVEDTGVPRILRDAQVLPIWEGTTNVLSLDTLRALGKDGTLDAYHAELDGCLHDVHDSSLAQVAQAAREAYANAREWLGRSTSSQPTLEAGARRFAMTLGRTLQAALLASHAQWCIDHGRGPRAAAAARRFARHGLDLVGRQTHGGDDDAKVLSDGGTSV